MRKIGRFVIPGRKHTPEQIIRKLRQGEELLSQGESVEFVCRDLQITTAIFHRWRNQYGDMKAQDAKRLKELEVENQRLKKIVADQAFDSLALKELAKGNF